MSETITREVSTKYPTGLEAYIAKLNKKAAKLGVAPLTYVKTGETTETERVLTLDRVDDGDIFGGIEGRHRIDGSQVTVSHYTITGEVPVLAGWQLAAVVEPTDTGESLMFSSGAVEHIPDRYRTLGHVCEHCNKKRTRNRSYICYKAEGEEFKQVGSSCIKDFLGGVKSPEDIFEFVSDLFLEGKFNEDDFERMSGGCGVTKTYATADVLEVSATVILGRGKYEKAEYDEADTYRRNPLNYPTTERVRDILENNIPSDEKAWGGKLTRKEVWEQCKAIATDDLVRALLAEHKVFCEALDDSTDYHKNIKVALACERSPKRALGLLASSIGYMQGKKKMLAMQADRDAKNATAGPAPTGRVEVTGEVLSVKTVCSDFGETEKMIMRLENGSRAYLTVPAGISVTQGDSVRLTASFTVSATDPKFCYGKRPSKASVIKPAVAQA